jgi:hypothetical protein
MNKEQPKAEGNLAASEQSYSDWLGSPAQVRSSG